MAVVTEPGLRLILARGGVEPDIQYVRSQEFESPQLPLINANGEVMNKLIRCWKVPKEHITGVTDRINGCSPQAHFHVLDILPYDDKYFLLKFDGNYPYLENEIHNEFPGIE